MAIDIIFFFLLILSSCTSLVLSADQNDDYLTLLKIKEQLGNPDFLSSWVYGFDFCNNHTDDNNLIYVTCTGTGRVKTFAIRSTSIYWYPLSAPFPQAICDLTELEMLSISNVGIHGSIPSCINNLINLREVYIWRTFLGGSIPEFLNLNNLTTIDLERNSFEGSIPPSLSKLPNLRSLNLYWNYLTGSIPPGLVHGPSASLVLSDNGLTGEIPRCYGLVDFSDIDLSINRLTGDASFLFGKHKTVTSINLNRNQLEFDLSYVEIPENLTSLDLSSNGIYGKVPDSIASASKLSSLNLMFTRLCGRPLPPCSNSAPTPAPLFAPPFDSTP